MARTATPPWWLDRGSECCGGCSHSFAPEIVYRCTGCDTAVCVCCAVLERATREAWCPECERERKAEVQ